MMRLPTPPLLQTARLCLRPFAAADITAQYLGWLNDPAVTRYSNQRLRRHDLASCRRYLDSSRDCERLFLAIVDRSERLLGTMTACFALAHGTADVGLMVGAKECWGTGIGREAWHTLCDWLLGPQAGVRKLTGGAARPNLAMLRIMQGYDMQLEAVRRQQEIIEGEAVDLLYYARFREQP